MPRPTTKDELITLSQTNYTKLIDLISSYTEEERDTDFPPGIMNRNISDVLAHLHERHLMMIGRYTVGMTGQKPIMPAPGYTRKNIPDLNRTIREKRQGSDFDTIKQLCDTSYTTIQTIINQHTDIELFEKKKYHRTGSTSLGSYLISATSSHYDRAYKLIKKQKKKQNIDT